VHGTREEPLLTVMLAFGLRRGEALGLHWSALDWDAATLKVTHAVKRVRDRTETSELGDAAGSGQRVALVLPDLPAGGPRPLAPP
jgi:integrase